MATSGGRGSQRGGERSGRKAERRAELGRAAVEIAGEIGYEALTVQRLIERVGVSRSHFYRLFADKSECYLAGEGELFAWLEAELRSRCADRPSWAEGLEASLERFAAFLTTEPFLARGVLVESRVAGGAALELRFEVSERLSHAVDAARRESQSRHSPPPGTASFILGAIETTAVGFLMEGRPERFAAAVPDLVEIAVRIYFGDRADSDAGT